MSFPTVQHAPTVAHPSERDWEAARSRIEQLYIDENFTCNEVSKLMKEELGLDATKRMYKARFKAWGLDKKSIKGVEYEAMLMLYESWYARGVEVEFTARQGTGRKHYQISEVKKHLGRDPRNAVRKREQSRKKIHQLGIDHILRRKDIRYQPVSSSSSSRSPAPISEDSDSDQELELELRQDASVEDPQFLAAPLIQAPLNPQSFDSRLQADLDMRAIFDRFGLDEYYTGPCFDLTPTVSQEQTDTEEWAYHVLLTSIKTDEGRTDLAGNHRQKARHKFRQMLTTANPYILTSLIHISCVLQSIGGVEIYRLFLRDCCELIRREQGRYLPYATPYLYALASEDGDRAAVTELGNQLLCGPDLIHVQPENLSPNLLVSQQYRAYHLLKEMKQPEGALEILRQCLGASEHVLDKNHMVIVNGLNLLARAHERMGNKQIAIDIYIDAAGRCAANLGSKHPFCLIILRRMAVLQAESGAVDDAEQNFRQVFWSRCQLLGPGHAYTYASGTELEQFLHRQGRHGDAKQVKEFQQTEYHKDEHWKVLSEQDQDIIRRQVRHGLYSNGLYWQRARHGLSKYEFRMPMEAYMHPSKNINFRGNSSSL